MIMMIVLFGFIISLIDYLELSGFTSLSDIFRTHTFLCLFQPRTWFSNTIYVVVFFVFS